MRKILLTFLFTSLMILPHLKYASAQGAISIQIYPVFKGKKLVLKEKMYETDQGDFVSIEEFKFYMSALTFLHNRSVFKELNSYHLIDIEDSNSLFYKVENLPEGNYESFQFNIGVDSTASVSGALDGALDPTLGMYWAWNTGYINAKLVGTSPSCKTLHNQFEFHIGGYKEPYIALRKVSIPISNITIEKGKTSNLVLYVDVSKWFTGIHLTALNNVVLPSVEALRMADNYMEMFSTSLNADEHNK